ncbi:SDR family NAD(P)-dependent oxidoreductase [Paraburkholderia youngii]|uniref:SDR family oxidoreductase n=1 Tax=Paraburkholderia youngii TaxID=2782701 RepID=A0ABX2NDZ2_9BURK|nr:SDR family oxidoreductase [Paraburkholderia youngii]NVI02556.1 SDR family oxidoreductase [Paraburkholderia youngii]
MDLQLGGKRALVTGSNSGIGEGIAKVLAREGAVVVVHGRNEGRCRNVAEAITTAGGKVSYVVGDLSDEAACNGVADQIIERLGGVDILVNNAGGRANSHRMDGKGGAMNPAWLETPWTDWLWTFEQNVGAAVRLIQKLVPGMKERGFGRIINIGSAAATQVEPDLAEYQAIKAAMVNMSASLAKTLAATGITVNTVTPGIIMSPAVKSTFTDLALKQGWDVDDWAEVERRFTSQIFVNSAGKFGEPEDIGRMVALLASPLSGYMTGANYRVDGGQVRSIN